ncbi:MAG TPA: IS30 family transposase [Patescibacteria group bacterium]|nr:IS30 family transposase [Gammaproteobacteria bacterium]HWA51472.1 IS30 family transposase [Patescibacteria group bacterium]
MGKYTQLSVTDRRRIYVYLEMGMPVSEICQKVGKHRSTVYRELNRNREPEGYFPVLAEEKRQERRKRSYLKKLQRNGILRDYVIKGLKKGWSPEQIAGRMKHQQLSFNVCHETIYQFIYASKEKELYHYLAYKKPKRRKRYGRKKQPCRYGKIRLITQRPEDIITRKRFGHWEGDTIAFSGTRERAVTTLVERKSRLVYLIKNDRKYSRGVMDKIKGKFEILPKKMCKTITFDQGSEFADYRHLEREIKCKVYYCEAHSPWQKGSNENMNGRLRWYLPRSTDIANTTQEELDQLASKMNHCPRKCIGYKTPYEMFIQQYKNDCRIWS